MKVIIAEKPSVAKNIADAIAAKSRRDGFFEGADFLVTWAFGHLLELYDARDYDEKMGSWKMDHFPFIPETFKYKVKQNGGMRGEVDAGALKQIETIRALMQRPDVDGIINACDFDREGQIIGDIIIEYLNVPKPVDRLLLNEWTPEEVIGGLKKIVPNLNMAPLRDAGICRQWADWIIGINLTSVASLKYQRNGRKPLNIGRVLLPTLKIIYDRDLEIENFVSESFHKLTGTFKTAKGEVYEGVYTEPEGDKFTDGNRLEALKEGFQKQPFEVLDKRVELKREYPPSLFNLSGLQGHITGKYKGWTSDKVLTVAQGLYEKKLITYPRTASLALEESLIEKAERVLKVHMSGLPYASEIEFHTQKRVFDNAKVESHSAIIPTYMIAKGLSPDEKIVYDAVKNRFVMQFMPVATHEETTLITKATTEVENAHPEGAFVSKGRTQLVEGWRKVEAVQTKEKLLPMVETGEAVSLQKLKLETKGTQPPKHHTEKTLLRVMETCGKRMKSGSGKNDDKDPEADEEANASDEINESLAVEGIDADSEPDQEEEALMQAILSGFSIGTPATRAETITKLKRVGYIDTKGKSLICTEMGRKLVEKFPVKTLFDLEYTGKLEKTLSDISKGEVTQQAFMDVIVSFTKEAVELIKKDDFHVIGVANGQATPNPDSLGKCPGCGADVIETEKAFGCSNWKSGCKFVVWKDDKFLASLKVVPSRMTVEKLLEKGEVGSNSFMSKKGTHFSARLRYEKDPDSGHYNWKMFF